jgi:hypothetical protein
MLTGKIVMLTGKTMFSETEGLPDRIQVQIAVLLKM